MKESTSPQTRSAAAWIVFAVLLLFCAMRMLDVIALHDFAYAQKTLPRSFFNPEFETVELWLIVAYSILLVVFMPWDDNPESVISPVMKTLVGYYIVRFCYACVIGCFIFEATFGLLLSAEFPFSGFLYAAALVLTIGMMLSLLRMASVFYAHRIKQGSRK